MIQPGVVLGIDREYVDVNGTRTGQVRALLQTGEQIEACYAGDPPWPLATALFEGPGEWFCVGPIGDRRLIVHDDFCAETAPYGDTEWEEAGTGSTSKLTEPGAGQAGVVEINGTTGATSMRIRKTHRAVTLPDDRAVWMTARYSIDAQAVAKAFPKIGLADNTIINAAPNATSAAVFASHDGHLSGPSPAGGAYVALTTASGVAASFSTTGEDVVAGAWHWLDLMVVGGQWAAMWLDGSGPWIHTTDVPDDSLHSVTPFAMCDVDLTGTPTLALDLVRLEMVSPVANPDGIAIPPVPVGPYAERW